MCANSAVLSSCVLVSRTPLRIAVALALAAMLAVLPFHAAFATSEVTELGTEPSQLWHLEYEAAWSPDLGIDIIAPPDPAARTPSAAVVLHPGEYLSVGQSVTSPNGWYRLTLEPDGRLVLRATDDGWGRYGLLWSSGPVDSADSATPLLLMRSDGELVVYDTASPAFGGTAPDQKAATLWNSDSHSASGAVLRLDNSGALSVVTLEGRALWHAGNSAPDVGLAGSRHIVYDRGEQWVWLVDADGSVVDNYPVSGHRESPVPGRYEVTSKSEEAISYNWLVTMRHMVRFTTDVEGDWIGFHSIPRGWRDTPVQTEAQLGDSLSLGCVRQRDDKAERLFDWASIGTPVVVLA